MEGNEVREVDVSRLRVRVEFEVEMGIEMWRFRPNHNVSCRYERALRVGDFLVDEL